MPYTTFSEYGHMIKKHQNDAEGQEKQRHYIIEKVNFLSFQGSTAPFAIKQGGFLFVPCDRIQQRAH